MIISEIAEEEQNRFNNLAHLFVLNALNGNKFTRLIVEYNNLRTIDLNG